MSAKDYFSKIFEASPIPEVILVGKFPNIIIKEVNPAYSALTGRRPNELIGTPFFITSPHPAMYLNEEGFKAVEESVKKVFLQRKAVKTPMQRFLKPIPNSSDFETLYLEATNTPVFDKDGEIDFIVRTILNVTDIIVATEKEKAKDRQLIENERFLRESQKVARIGSWEMDKNNRFHWSDIHYDIMEVDRGTEITVDFGINLLRRQEDKDVFGELYKGAVQTGDYFDVELNITTPKGNERWIRFTGKGELKDGEFVRMYGMGQDVTEQKVMQQQLTDSRNQLSLIIQTVEGAFFEVDAQTLQFNFVSEQITDLLGYTQEECIQTPNIINQIIFSDDINEILTQAARQIQTQVNYTGDCRVIKKDGELKWMKVSIAVIEENGAPKWLRGMMMDITASKRISELEHIEKKVLEITANPSATTVEVLTTYLQGIEMIFPEMQCAIMQEVNGQLQNWAAISLPLAYLAAIDNLPINDNTGSCGTAAFLNQTVIVNDIATDYRWTNFKEVALENNLRSCWSQPIRNAAGEVIATLAMYYKSVKIPTEEELNVIDRTANLLQVILQHRHDVELLEEAKLLMEQSQEIAHFGSVQYDIANNRLVWSKELFNIFGLDSNLKPTVELYYSVLHPEDRELSKSVIESAIQKREDFVTEERIVKSDGEIRDLKTWGRIKLDENGEILKIVATYLDITESKKTQEDLVASESRLRSLVNSQTNYVIRIDFNEHYTYVNNKYLEDFGPATGESLIGTHSMRSVTPDQRKKITAVCQKAIAQPNEVIECELKKYGSDGNIKYTFWHFVCLTNSQGDPKEIQCIGIDISDLKAAENEREKKTVELRESEKKYSDLFQLSPQPMWVYDPDTLRFLDVNNAAIIQYGYTRNEFLKMTIKDIQPVEQSLKIDAEQQEFYNGVFTNELKSGELITVDIKQTQIPFRGKSANLSLAHNITEPIKYLQALEKQNELLSEIAWIQSHAVRAPLARIIGLVDLLKTNSFGIDERSFMLTAIAAASAELDNIIKDIVRKAERVTVIDSNSA